MITATKGDRTGTRSAAELRAHSDGPDGIRTRDLGISSPCSPVGIRRDVRGATREWWTCSTAELPADAGRDSNPRHPCSPTGIRPEIDGPWRRESVRQRVLKLPPAGGIRTRISPVPCSSRGALPIGTLCGGCSPTGIRHGLVQTSVCLTMLTQSRVSPRAKRATVSNTASEKPPTLRMSARPEAWVVP